MILTERAMPVELIGRHALPCVGAPIRLLYLDPDLDLAPYRHLGGTAVASADVYRSATEVQVGFVHLHLAVRGQHLTDQMGSLLVQWADGRLIHWSRMAHPRIARSAARIEAAHAGQPFVREEYS